MEAHLNEPPGAWGNQDRMTLSPAAPGAQQRPGLPGSAVDDRTAAQSEDIKEGNEEAPKRLAPSQCLQPPLPVGARIQKNVGRLRENSLEELSACLVKAGTGTGAERMQAARALRMQLGGVLVLAPQEAAALERLVNGRVQASDIALLRQALAEAMDGGGKGADIDAGDAQAADADEALRGPDGLQPAAVRRTPTVELIRRFMLERARFNYPELDLMLDELRTRGTGVNDGAGQERLKWLGRLRWGLLAEEEAVRLLTLLPPRADSGGRAGASATDIMLLRSALADAAAAGRTAREAAAARHAPGTVYANLTTAELVRRLRENRAAYSHLDLDHMLDELRTRAGYYRDDLAAERLKWLGQLRWGLLSDEDAVRLLALLPRTAMELMLLDRAHRELSPRDLLASMELIAHGAFGGWLTGHAAVSCKGIIKKLLVMRLRGRGKPMTDGERKAVDDFIDACGPGRNAEREWRAVAGLV